MIYLLCILLNHPNSEATPNSKITGAYSTVYMPSCSFSEIFFSYSHLTSTYLTLAFVNNRILHLLLVLCTAVNVRNKN